ncbi:MAG: helix-turn-helix transcriptional regulator [Ruminococcaceae bacterium]|nr:helix-turn-helix transcriptional regulator [Oscillospiraceae bacterium]
MNIKIGAIIKKLRTENNVTQDALAAAIGVTPQAISRWESEGCYPDIELLPALADFFSVSTDELLGYKLSEREEELSRIKKEIERLSEVGTVEERISFARNALVKFPGDFEIKNQLAVCLYFKGCETGDKACFTESEALCKSIAQDCRDEDVRYDALFTLVSVYDEQKKPEKVQELVKSFTSMRFCREYVKSLGIGDGNTELYIQEWIDLLVVYLDSAIKGLVLGDDISNDPSTWDKKIQMLNTANDIYRMIYGDNLMFNHCSLSYNYSLISTYEIAQGKIEDTLDSLEKMCYHTVEYDKSYQNDHGKSYTSIFTDKLIYPFPCKDFHELTEHNQCYYSLNAMNHTRYDCIRDNERFIAVVKTLQEYAR